jgi:hypothetical protein
VQRMDGTDKPTLPGAVVRQQPPGNLLHGVLDSRRSQNRFHVSLRAPSTVRPQLTRMN